MTGTVVGYDPGGNDKHGLALAKVEDGEIVSVTTKTLGTVEKVLTWICKSEKPLVGLGIDTLTCWSTGRSGWRPADRWLRCQYCQVKNSVIASNSLSGSMSVNGMAVLFAVRQAFPRIFVTETHPKVLYYARSKRLYDYKVPNKSVMDKHLSESLDGVDVAPEDDHQWDAAISILPVVRGLDGKWQNDLHAMATNDDERLVRPCSGTAYMWPEGKLAK